MLITERPKLKEDIMNEQDVNELKESLMTEEDVNDKYDLWLTKLSKFIISRSSKLVSSETQKDGRILLFLSALSSIFLYWDN